MRKETVNLEQYDIRIEYNSLTDYTLLRLLLRTYTALRLPL